MFSNRVLQSSESGQYFSIWALLISALVLMPSARKRSACTCLAAATLAATAALLSAFGLSIRRLVSTGLTQT